MCDPLKVCVYHNPDNLVSPYSYDAVRRTGMFMSYENIVRLLRTPIRTRNPPQIDAEDQATAQRRC